MSTQEKPICDVCWTLLRLRYACACFPLPPVVPAKVFVPLAEFRRQAILAVLRQERSLNRTARVLGISRETVHRIVQREAA